MILLQHEYPSGVYLLHARDAQKSTAGGCDCSQKRSRGCCSLRGLPLSRMPDGGALIVVGGAVVSAAEDALTIASSSRARRVAFAVFTYLTRRMMARNAAVVRRGRRDDRPGGPHAARDALHGGELGDQRGREREGRAGDASEMRQPR